MSARKEPEQKSVAADDFLRMTPQRAAAIEVEPAEAGLVVSIPIPRPGWLVPPLSWVFQFRPFRKIELDPLGTAVLNLCDGRRTVEEVIATFAQNHKLSFRESQVAVTQFLRQLLQRRIITLTGG